MHHPWLPFSVFFSCMPLGECRLQHFPSSSSITILPLYHKVILYTLGYLNYSLLAYIIYNSYDILPLDLLRTFSVTFPDKIMQLHSIILCNAIKLFAAFSVVNFPMLSNSFFTGPSCHRKRRNSAPGRTSPAKSVLTSK